MSKELKRTYILTTIVCLLPIVAAILLYNQMPDQIVTHWDAAGNPNGWSSKFVGSIVFPGGLVVLNLIFPLILKMDPKYHNISDKVKSMVLWIIPCVSLFASTITLASAIGKDVKIQFYGPLFMGLLFVVIGNYLPKTSQSYTVGIKIPWTLNDEENWKKTHRFSGFLWVIGGILMIISAFISTKYSTMGIVVLAAIMVIVPMIYSYMLYVKKNR